MPATGSAWHDLSFDLRTATWSHSKRWRCSTTTGRFATGRKAIAAPTSGALPSETFDALFARTVPAPRAVQRSAPLPAAGAKPTAAKRLSPPPAHSRSHPAPTKIDDAVVLAARHGGLPGARTYRAGRAVLRAPAMRRCCRRWCAWPRAAALTVDLLLPRAFEPPSVSGRRAQPSRAAYVEPPAARIWHLAPQMLHAKLAIVDHTMALATARRASDSRSLFLNWGEADGSRSTTGARDRARFVAWIQSAST